MAGLVADTISFSDVDGPGNRFVVFLQGCNFDCLACHNPQTIPGHAPLDGFGPKRQSVEDLVAQIKAAAPFIRGITVSGGEATQQSDFMADLFVSVKADVSLSNLTCLVDSNGACPLDTWDRLAPVMDGAMIDLKCFDSTIHAEMTGQPNDSVLASIAHLAGLDLLYEVRMLVIAGVNDDPGLMAETANWLASVDTTMRVKLIGFRPHGVRPHDPPLQSPSPETLERVAEQLRSAAQFQIEVV